MKIDLSRISICGVHDFKNAIINLSNDVFKKFVYPLPLYIEPFLKTKDPIRVWLLDVFCSVFNCMYSVLLSPCFCFISFLCIDLYVLGDDSWMGWGSFMTGQTFMCLDPFLNLFLTLSETS